MTGYRPDLGKLPDNEGDAILYRVEIDVRGGRAFAINASGWTTTVQSRAFRTRNVEKAQRLANALKRWNPIIRWDPETTKQS